MSCGQLVVVFIILKDFLESRKNWSFSWPRTCEKNVIFGHFTNLHISHPNEQIFTFQVSWGQLMVVFISLKGFLESRKNWRFSWPRTCEKVSFLGISQTCIFFIQMSKYLHFMCTGVNWWCFSSFWKTFWRVEKIESFHDPGPARKMSFWAFHKLAYFSPKWTNIYILSVLWSAGGSFHHFERLFGKSKKLKFFMTADLREKCHFWAFHKLAYFSPKWTNIYISSVLGSTDGGFHQFERLFEKSKKLKIFMTADLRKSVIFGHFTNLHIFHPNEQIFTFHVYWGQLVVFFIILKDFLESRKNWKFSWPRPCEKNVILGISQTCIFLTQMNKYLHFKCPVVSWW